MAILSRYTHTFKERPALLLALDDASEEDNCLPMPNVLTLRIQLMALLERVGQMLKFIVRISDNNTAKYPIIRKVGRLHHNEG